jgi:hypothetical protein
MQETRGLRPATVSRRVSVVAGFYRTCVIDAVLERSPAQFVRRPRVPAESPTLGFTHLQFEALLAAGRDSANRHDFALVAMLGLLGLRMHGKGDKVVQVRCRQPSSGRSTALSTVAPVGPFCAAAPAPGWIATAPPDDYTAWPNPPASRGPECTRTCSNTPS